MKIIDDPPLAAVHGKPDPYADHSMRPQQAEHKGQKVPTSGELPARARGRAYACSLSQDHESSGARRGRRRCPRRGTGVHRHPSGESGQGTPPRRPRRCA